MARHLISQLGTVIVSLLTNDMPFKHVYSMHINRFPFTVLVFSAAVCSLKVSRSLYDAPFFSPSALPRTHLLATAPEQTLARPHANSCCSAVATRTPGLADALPTNEHERVSILQNNKHRSFEHREKEMTPLLRKDCFGLVFFFQSVFFFIKANLILTDA